MVSLRSCAPVFRFIKEWINQTNLSTPNLYFQQLHKVTNPNKSVISGLLTTRLAVFQQWQWKVAPISIKTPDIIMTYLQTQFSAPHGSWTHNSSTWLCLFRVVWVSILWINPTQKCEAKLHLVTILKTRGRAEHHKSYHSRLYSAELKPASVPNTKPQTVPGCHISSPQLQKRGFNTGIFSDLHCTWSELLQQWLVPAWIEAEEAIRIWSRKFCVIKTNSVQRKNSTVHLSAIGTETESGTSRTVPCSPGHGNDATAAP